MEKRSQFDRAIALEYQDPEALPRILLSGAGELARKIIDYAEGNNIPVMEDGTLVDMLSGLPSGAAVSPESFEIVSEIISFLYLSDQEWAAQHSFIGELLEE